MPFVSCYEHSICWAFIQVWTYNVSVHIVHQTFGHRGIPPFEKGNPFDSCFMEWSNDVLQNKHVAAGILIWHWSLSLMLMGYYQRKKSRGVSITGPFLSEYTAPYVGQQPVIFLFVSRNSEILRISPQPLHSQQPGIDKRGCFPWSSSSGVSVSRWHFSPEVVSKRWDCCLSHAFTEHPFQVHWKQPNQFDFTKCFPWTEDLSASVSMQEIQ